MVPNQNFSVIVALKIGLLTALMALGIGLFFVRDQKMPKKIAHEIIFHAQPSSQRIVANEFLISVRKSNLPRLYEVLDPLGLEIKMPILNWILVGAKNPGENSFIRYQSDEAEGSRSILNSLLEHSFVLDAHHNYVLDAATVPNNFYFSDSWHLQTRLEELFALNMPEAWDISEGLKDVTIAVVDQFISHNSLSFADRFESCMQRIAFARPFTHLSHEDAGQKTPHGELMLLALGACNNNRIFSPGINFHSQIRAVERPSLGHAQSFLAALFASGIDVCQESIAECPAYAKDHIVKKPPEVLLLPFGNPAPELLQFTADILSAIKQKNVITVTAAGNNSSNADSYFPGGAPYILNVGASNRTGERADFSNWGQAVDILAPGDDIYFYYPSGLKTAQGTSLSAASIAGIVSLMKSVMPNLSVKAAEYFLRESSLPMACDAYCLSEKNGDGELCQDHCCLSDMPTCGSIIANAKNALIYAKQNYIDTALLDLDNFYLLFLKNEIDPKMITVSNIGNKKALVSALAYDPNIKIEPSEFDLGGFKSANSEKTLAINFIKEPFKQQTFKIELRAHIDGRIVDRSHIFIEYIPKK